MHPEFTETVYLCRTIWPGGMTTDRGLGLDGGTSTDPREAMEWIVDCDLHDRPVRVDRIEYDATGDSETVRDVTAELRRRLAEQEAA